MIQTNEGTLGQSVNLLQAIDKILDKGIVVAGDIKIKLVDVELLSLQVRLVVCSIDKAEQIGLDFWNRDWQGTLITSKPGDKIPAKAGA